MNDTPAPAQPHMPLTVTLAPPAPRSFGRGLLVALLLVFLLCGVPLGLAWWGLGTLFHSGEDLLLTEQPYAGQKYGADKVAIIRIEGVLMEGMLGYAIKQIDQAAEDRQVKAVVLRINSPGGTITASDAIHHKLLLLRDGDPLRNTAGKPLVVSMGSLAASGGYYVAMPAKTLFAERTTATGSIGVFAALPNVKELSDKIGVKMIVIKRGGVKDSGSPFHEMTPTEQAHWQSLIDSAYDRFKAVVEEGRPNLKGRMEEEALSKQVVLAPDAADAPKQSVNLVRRRADGGTFTANEALELGLIDKIGHLEDAVQEARRLAGLGDQSRVILYGKPPTFLGLFGLDVRHSPDSAQLANALVPRIWYLSSHCELAGFARALGMAGFPDVR